MTTRATYSPEDNKLRLYVGRVPRADYERLRAAGFTSTPKQTCDFVATWTPAREDLALEFLAEGEDIGDEDYSPEERAADRADRFAGYREKRRDEASAHADTFEAGPSAFGHQNRQRAERQASRHDRQRTKAVSQWSKAEYWQQRTAGVIAHALHRSSASVRRGRLLRLESEARRYKMSERWENHYKLRIEYEKAMLAVEGGMAADAEMEPGGWIGNHQIHAVNKSPATGRVVSVKLMAPKPWYRGEGPAPLTLQSFNIERLGESAYRAPTDEEREAFKVSKAARKAEAKASKPAGPPLINPTDEDAERLQAIWNAHAEDRKCKPAEVRRMTQAEYSAGSKGTYSWLRTAEVSEQLRERHSTAMGRDRSGRVTVFKVRKSGYGGTDAARVIVLTDAPQKPIPWDAVEAAREKQPSEDKLFYRLDDIQAAAALDWLPEKDSDAIRLLDDAHYVGWVYISSMTQFGLTEKGVEAWQKFVAIKDEGGVPVENGTLYSQAVLF